MAAARRFAIAAGLAALAWWAWPRLPDAVRAPWHIARLSLRVAPPSHLHYGIYASGGAINPYPLLTSGNARSTSIIGPP